MSEVSQGFGVVRRNYGHWDIVADEGRLFRIRGGPGFYEVFDERGKAPRKGEAKMFKTVGMCMGYICDELMFELIAAEGQAVQTIESWNVPRP